LEKHLDKTFKKYYKLYKNEYVTDCLNHSSIDPRELDIDDALKIEKKWQGIYFTTII